MKKSLLFLLLFLIAGCSSTSSLQIGSKPVETRDEAIAIAVEHWINMYGKEQIDREKPYKAIPMGAVWVVHGTKPNQEEGPVVLTGVAWATISKNNGKLLGMTHTTKKR
ncbi:NTF2 fold immunity protein [Planctomycetota bacterium]